MTWTPERRELTKKLWQDGLSTGQIVRELGAPYVTRSAVIGIIHRAGLSGRGPTKTPAKRRLPPSHSINSVAVAHARTARQFDPGLNERQPKNAPTPLRIPLVDLTRQHCRWPIGDPASADFAFCGHPRLAERSYCPAHCAIAYQAVDKTRRRTAPT